MITERRQITFSVEALKDVLDAFRRTFPDRVPHGSIRRVWLDEAPEATLCAQIEQSGARTLHEVRYGRPEIAAFLIFYCRQRRIPLPRSSYKFIEVDNGDLSLILTSRFETRP